MRYLPIYDIAELCSKKGLNQVVLCPGSRCAPLTLAFARHTSFTVRTFSDERSAAFIAAGIAQQSAQPCILICTSGTAAYNFAPAVAEGYFNQIPLIVFTADRPVEWIGQQDGQAIFQSGIYEKHVKGSFQLPQEYDHEDDVWMVNRVVNEAINLANQEPKGPVHINAPFREPLYPQPNEPVEFNKSIRVIDVSDSSRDLDVPERDNILTRWSGFHRILIVSGQQEKDSSLSDAIEKAAAHYKIPVVGEIVSNLHAIESSIRHSDLILGLASDERKRSLQPDLLITLGRSVISKNLKSFLRNYAPGEHWHIQDEGPVPDTFRHLTRIIRTRPSSFFDMLYTQRKSVKNLSEQQGNYFNRWEAEERRIAQNVGGFFSHPELEEFNLVKEVLDALPSTGDLHLANSMSVRYANAIGLNSRQSGIRVWSNRGTSGIDGCTSTAVGHALQSTHLNVLITGDLAFFYDRNAFWHNYPLPNLRIVLLNNHGGGIFNVIEGPASIPERIPYFVTEQRLNARKLCEEYGFQHLLLDRVDKLTALIKDFFEPGSVPKIMEIEGDSTSAKLVFEKFKKQIKEGYEY